MAEECCGRDTSLCPWSWQVKRGLGGAEDLFSFDRTLSKVVQLRWFLTTSVTYFCRNACEKHADKDKI